jgi:lipoprotein-anchoring transpeptidase ErfK/SrfK
MKSISRRTFVLGTSSAVATLAVASSALGESIDRSLPGDSFGFASNVNRSSFGQRPRLDPESAREYAGMYAEVLGEPFPIPAVDLAQIDPAFLRQEVDYFSVEPAGTIIVDPYARYLYHLQPGGRATRYGVGVGRQGFGWSGVASINSKQEWPDWYPPLEMVERQPEIAVQLVDLRSGRGVAGGVTNPLGSRALYLWQDNKDTLYRIHGTFEPWTIGTNVSSGCIRMINQDVIHLYQRTPVGTNVVVLG